MTPDDAFLHAIIENPDDDTPRLIYAAWLEEHGQPERADFIRVQCVLAADRPEDRPHRKQLEQREKTLWARYGKRWARPFRKLTESVGFRRGFVENVRLDGREDLAGRVLRVVSLAPMRYLWVGTCWDGDADLPALGPSLSQLRGFMVQNIFHINETGLQELLTSPHLAGLETLFVHCNHNWPIIGQHLFRAIVTSPRWQRLHELSLGSGHNGLNNAAVRALARSPSMAGLTHLDLGSSHMQASGAKALATSPYLTRLTELNLSFCMIGEWGKPIRVAAWRPLVDSPNLAKLRWLGLWEAHLDETVKRMWQDRFDPTILDFESNIWVRWRSWIRHRWNRYFPEEACAAFLATGCGSGA